VIVIEAVVSPLDHKYEPPPVAVKIVLWPEQMLVVPEIETVGYGLIVTATAVRLLSHPFTVWLT
jgi:hypothetical protein